METCKRFLRRTVLLMAVLTALIVAAAAADASAATADEFYKALETALKAQTDNFSITYTGDKEDLGLTDDSDLGQVLRTMSARSSDGPDNADYPALNIADGLMCWLDEAYYFDIDYLATQEEIDEVSRRAQEIVDSFDLSQEDDYTKIKLLYEYICTHYTYDDTLTKFSAYDGLTTGSMVCQGYALLTYKVMWSAGIPSRIVTGVSQQENHAWNIVKLNGVWYNLDTTWDAADEIGGVMHWNYFLKSEADFTGHTRFNPYITDNYNRAHPMAKKSMELPKMTVVVNGSDVVNLVVRAGVEVQLEAQVPAGMDSEIQWSSSNPDLVAVTADGRVLASGLGNVVLTASVSGNRGVISAQIPTEVVDLRQTSAWAYQDVTDYYLAQLLPPSLCSSYQQGITRAELARLCSQFLLVVHSWDPISVTTDFADIANSPDYLDILRCEDLGLMDGTSATTFSPDRTVTREQAAVVLSRLAAYLTGETSETAELSYTDADTISAWAADAVGAMTVEGVLRGDDLGAFSPKEAMTREQMFVALWRLYGTLDLHTAEAA